MNTNTVDFGRFWGPSEKDFLLYDARIYNHALSIKEIKELSKAKVLHYTFNKDNGSIVYDNTGLIRTGTVYGAKWNNYGAVGIGSYKFDKAGIEYISTNKRIFPTTDTTAPYSVSAWINPKNFNSENWIIDQYTGSNSNRMILFTQTSTGIIRCFNGGFSVNSPSGVALNTWTHVAFTRNTNGDIRLFINGLLVNTGNLNRPCADVNTSIGNSFFSNYTINMDIDDVRVYATTLSDADILDLYQTKAKIDNQGNLYANEFVEDYDIMHKIRNIVNI